MTKRVEILHDFEGYPDGDDKPAVAYRTGAKPELADGFANLIVGKGHAREVADEPRYAAIAAPVPGVEPRK